MKTILEKTKNDKRLSKTIGIFALAAILITGFSLAPNSFAVIDSVTASVIDVSGAPPTDVSKGVTESNTDLPAFDEKQLVTLTSSVAVDHDGSVGGPFNAVSGTSDTIPIGTIVNSHYIHFDAELDDGTVFSETGSVTFVGKIIGVITDETVKTTTDTSLGLAGTTYTPGPRALEVQAIFQDEFTISNGGKTISVDWHTSTGVDAIRVITEPVTIETTAWAFGTQFNDGKSWAMYNDIDALCNETVILFAKQTIDVGTVDIDCDGTNVTVDFDLNPGVTLVGSHVDTENTVAEIPQNKKANPKIGQFEFTGGPTDDPIIVDDPEGGVIAIHLKVEIFEQLLP